MLPGIEFYEINNLGPILPHWLPQTLNKPNMVYFQGMKTYQRETFSVLPATTTPSAEWATLWKLSWGCSVEGPSHKGRETSWSACTSWRDSTMQIVIFILFHPPKAKMFCYASPLHSMVNGLFPMVNSQMNRCINLLSVKSLHEI